MITTPILIMGGGPAALTLALALSRLDVNSIVVNDRPSKTVHPGLDVLSGRSMEIFRQLNLHNAVRAGGSRADANRQVAFSLTAAGPRYAVLDGNKYAYQSFSLIRELIGTSRDGSLPLEAAHPIPQREVEALLLKQANRSSFVKVRDGWRVIRADQDPDGVTTTLQNIKNGQTQEVRSQFLVNGDETASAAQLLLNISHDDTPPLIGPLFTIHFQSAELAELFPDSNPYWHTWIAQPGFIALLVAADPLRGDYVIHRPYPPGKNEPLEQIIDRALGRTVKYKIVQSGSWQPDFRLAQQLHAGRVFLIGGAVQPHLPAGAMGMNTAIGDAHNLAWKLAAVLNGWGGPRLLESYGFERLAVARRHRDYARRSAAAAFQINWAINDTILFGISQAEQYERLAGDFRKTIPTLYESLGIELGDRYIGSPAVVAESEPEPVSSDTRYRPTTYAGLRLPSGFSANNAPIFDELSYDSLTLLTFGENDDAAEPLRQAAELANVPLRVVSSIDPALAALYERKFVLVRPDHHVAWRGDAIPADPTVVLDTVRGGFA